MIRFRHSFSKRKIKRSTGNRFVWIYIHRRFIFTRFRSKCHPYSKIQKNISLVKLPTKTCPTSPPPQSWRIHKLTVVHKNPIIWDFRRKNTTKKTNINSILQDLIFTYLSTAVKNPQTSHALSPSTLPSRFTRFSFSQSNSEAIFDDEAETNYAEGIKNRSSRIHSQNNIVYLVFMMCFGVVDRIQWEIMQTIQKTCVFLILFFNVGKWLS